MCQHNLPCSIVYAHCLLPGRAFASLYVLLFLEKEAEIGGRVVIGHNINIFLAESLNISNAHTLLEYLFNHAKTYDIDLDFQPPLENRLASKLTITFYLLDLEPENLVGRPLKSLTKYKTLTLDLL